jgi:excinuclease ABC subunit C
MEFETATVIRDRVRALQALMNRQSAVSGSEQDRDVLGIARNVGEACIRKLEIRSGRIVGSSAFFLEDRGEDDAEMIAAFVLQHYPDAPLIPPEILLPVLPGSTKLSKLTSVNSARPVAGLGLSGARRDPQVARHGRGKRNPGAPPQDAIGRWRAVRDRSRAGSTRSHVGADRRLTRIEAYDVSNTGTADKAASMVVFLDGRLRAGSTACLKSRRLKGRTTMRRCAKFSSAGLARQEDEAFGQTPDLILVDGGSGHLGIALEAIRASGLPVLAAGMVKDRRHRTRGLALPDGRVIELMPSAETERMDPPKTTAWSVRQRSDCSGS